MNDSLREQFLKIIDSGNEQAAKDFLIEHIKEFSEEIRNKIIAAFFAQALQKQADGINQVAALQKELLADFEETEKAQAAVADKKKELEIKEQLAK